MAKLGLTMEDIKEAQKQAAAKKASDKSGAQASGQKNGSNAANTAKKREEQKGKTVRVHNTNTAMGKALAAAMGGVSFDNSAETSTKKNAPAVQNASNDAKDISGLDYIRIPDTLTCPDTQDERILKEWHTIEALKEKKILNLSGFTNTDLKLEYGVGNLTELTDYDNNYVTLSRSLARIAELLTEQGLKKEAAAFLEFGIATHTDIGKNYTLLAGYYMEYGKPEKIDFLIAQAEQLSSLSKDPIIARLKAIQRGETSPA